MPSHLELLSIFLAAAAAQRVGQIGDGQIQAPGTITPATAGLISSACAEPNQTVPVPVAIPSETAIPSSSGNYSGTYVGSSSSYGNPDSGSYSSSSSYSGSATGPNGAGYIPTPDANFSGVNSSSFGSDSGGYTIPSADTGSYSTDTGITPSVAAINYNSEPQPTYGNAGNPVPTSAIGGQAPNEIIVSDGDIVAVPNALPAVFEGTAVGARSGAWAPVMMLLLAGAVAVGLM